MPKKPKSAKNQDAGACKPSERICVPTLPEIRDAPELEMDDPWACDPYCRALGEWPGAVRPEMEECAREWDAHLAEIRPDQTKTFDFSTKEGQQANSLYHKAVRLKSTHLRCVLEKVDFHALYMKPKTPAELRAWIEHRPFAVRDDWRAQQRTHRITGQWKDKNGTWHSERMTEADFTTRMLAYSSQAFDYALQMSHDPSPPLQTGNWEVDLNNLRRWGSTAGLRAPAGGGGGAEDSPYDKGKQRVAAEDEKPPHRGRGRPKEYSNEHKLGCQKHFQEWRTFRAEWKRLGKKGLARLAFAQSKNMNQADSDTMIRYGAPTRKKSRGKSRHKPLE